MYIYAREQADRVQFYFGTEQKSYMGLVHSKLSPSSVFVIPFYAETAVWFAARNTARFPSIIKKYRTAGVYSTGIKQLHILSIMCYTLVNTIFESDCRCLKRNKFCKIYSVAKRYTYSSHFSFCLKIETPLPCFLFLLFHTYTCYRSLRRFPPRIPQSAGISRFRLARSR